jgi:eukaryotic-like serine/threonine-protein kinase
MAVTMSKLKNPWDADWLKVDGFAEKGGQGKVVLVKRAAGVDTGERFALKELIRQDDMDRRGRMHREVAALQTVEHTGIPKFVDSNADQFKDRDVKLFLVSEYIPGPTLEKYSNCHPVDPKTAIGCALRLLDVIEFCHSRSLIHRDIKPDNIILRAGDPLSPVLIDFGLSFNADDEDDSLTETGQELGNRFLRLPELQHSGRAQRDARADLAQCCSILFYLVTGQIPRTLLDKDGRKPHLREQAIVVLNRLSDLDRDLLFAVFERGFEHPIDRRFQTAQEMRMYLTGTPSSTSREDETRKIERIRAAIGLDEIRQRNRPYVALLEEIGRAIVGVCRQVADELFGDEKSLPSACDLDPANLRLDMTQGLCHQGTPDKAFTARFVATITHTQLRLLAQDGNGKSTVLFECPLGGPIDWLACKEQLRAFYINGAHELLAARLPTPLARPLPIPTASPLNRAELSLQLRQLPLRAIVAFAARVARRVGFVFETLDDDTRSLLEQAIASADDYAKGDAASACGEAARKAQFAVTSAAARQPGGGPLWLRRNGAASAAYHAAFTAVFARQKDGESTVAFAVSAYEQANLAQPACHTLAIHDLRRLLTSGVGKFPEIGALLDTGQDGPLGPLWPGMTSPPKS